VGAQLELAALVHRANLSSERVQGVVMSQVGEGAGDGGVRRPSRQAQRGSSLGVEALPQELEVALGGRVCELAKKRKPEASAQRKSSFSFHIMSAKLGEAGLSDAREEATRSDFGEIGFAFGHGNVEA